MAMAPERSKPLHNFSLPYLKWGSQKFLKCMKEVSSSSPLDHLSTHRESKSYQFRTRPTNSPRNLSHFYKEKSNTMESAREKIILDIKEESKKLKLSIPEDGGEDELAAAAKPWNLRTRRAAACKAPQEDRKPLGSSSSSMKVITKKEKEKKEKDLTMLSVSLSKEEVEEDFAAMIGVKPPRRPKKRPRVVQKQLDSLFPGMWLMEVTLDSYKVADVPEA